MAGTKIKRTEDTRRPEEDSLTTATAPGSQAYKKKYPGNPSFVAASMSPQNGSVEQKAQGGSGMRRWIVPMAFLLPFTIRSIPEILAGPYPIGYDSIASYIPVMRDWAAGNFASQPSMMVGGPLVFAVLASLYGLTGIDPIFIVKVAGPIVYGVLGVSEYMFAKKYLLWDYKKSISFVLIASIYFVSLRLSWDLLRNTLAMAFLFLSLVLSKDLRTRRNSITFSALSLVTTATHVFTGSLLAVLVGLQSARHVDFRKSLLTLVPSVGWILSSLALFQATGIELVSISGQPRQLVNAYAFALYAFIPIIPVAVIGARARLPIVSRNWILLCLAGFVASTTPIFSISSQLIWPERWTFMLLFPLASLATEGFFRLQKVRWRTTLPRISLGYVWLLVLLILAATYISLPAREAMPYYQFVTPTSMLQSTVPAEDSQSVASAFQWLSTHAPSNSVIVTTDVMYGWSREYFTGQSTVLWFHSGSSLQDALSTVMADHYSMIYTVWWADGQGWYGNPTVPSGFQEIHQFGQFGVFLLINQ